MLNRATLLGLSFGLCALPCAAQDNAILVYDPVTQVVDTIAPASPEDTLSAFLPNGLGALPGSELLGSADSPAGFLGTANQYPPPAAQTVDLTKYPARVAGELRRLEGDSSWARCSGQLVGPWHVLTASHCLREWGSGAWRAGRIDFFPAFDNGAPSSSGSARAVRYYVPLQSSRDNALIQLDQPLGADLGWIGLGFTKDTAYFTNRVVHKFCYPADTSYLNENIIYNGDTMYHLSKAMVRSSSGSVDYVGVMAWAGIPGESGSGVWVADSAVYHVLGVCTWSSGYKHTLMDAGTFQQFRNILEDPFLGTEELSPATITARVYPNPVQTQATFAMDCPANSMHTLMLRDMSGRLMGEQQFMGSSCLFNRAGLSAGSYIYQITNADGHSIGGLVLFE